MSYPKCPHCPTQYSDQMYCLLRACISAARVQSLLLEVLEMQSTPHWNDQKIRIEHAARMLKDARQWLNNSRRTSPHSDKE